VIFILRMKKGMIGKVVLRNHKKGTSQRENVELKPKRGRELTEFRTSNGKGVTRSRAMCCDQTAE